MRSIRMTKSPLNNSLALRERPKTPFRLQLSRFGCNKLKLRRRILVIYAFLTLRLFRTNRNNFAQEMVLGRSLSNWSGYAANSFSIVAVLRKHPCLPRRRSRLKQFRQAHCTASNFVTTKGHLTDRMQWRAMLAASLSPSLEAGTNVIFGWGWLVVVGLMLWIVWKVYLYIKMVDYVAAINWTFLQVAVPEDAEQTPKAMENIFAVLDGIHKNPDLIERYFEGYLEAWYSCELVCTKGRARYVLVVPTVHKTFFEGVIYGQYPEAEVVETQDYTLAYDYKEIDKTFDLYGSEIILTEEDIYPVKTYRDYEDVFAEEEKFIDPHQALVEAYTNINEAEQFWVQVLVRPIDGKDIKKWAEKGGEEIDKLAGKDVKKPRGILSKSVETMAQLPADAIRASMSGPMEAGKAGGLAGLDFPRVSAGDTAKMDGILQKVSKGGYRVKIRVLYLAPMGQLTKPNISRSIGGFKQFNTYNLNSFKPDPETKTNGPNYFFKKTRRYRRKREILLTYQWRDFWGYKEGFMMSDEELATLYHFPTKYSKAPAFVRAKAGVGAAPENVPYV